MELTKLISISFCQVICMCHTPHMRSDAACFASYRFSMLSLLALLTMLLASCGGGGGGGSVSENRSIRGYNPGVGPFDNQGNYVERWANDKSKGSWWRKSIISDPTITSQPTAVASNTSSAPKPKVPTSTAASASSKPVSKPPVASAPKPSTVVKATPQRKAPIRYTIKKGDTLWALSRKYNTSVTAIQRANGLKGSNLKIGRTLLIPRY